MILFVQPYQTPAPRLASTLHYVIARTAGRDFGATKLNKAIVEADSEFYRRYGRTITGAEAFQKQKFGPVPNGVVKALNELRASGRIVLNSVPTPAGPRNEYVSTAEPELDKFDSAEIDVLNVAISSLERYTAEAASERTHDALWQEIPMFGQIPIRAAAFKPAAIDQEVLSWALS